MIRAIVLVVLFGSRTYGALVLDVEIDPPSPAPSTTLVTVSARKLNENDDDILMTAANLAIDFGINGFGLPAGFSLLSASSPAFTFVQLNTGLPQALETNGQNPNFDAIINLDTGTLNIDSTTDKVLFELEIGIAAGVPAETKALLSFVENPLPGGFFSVTPKNVGGLPLQIRTVSGSVSVVPEPSSLLLMSLIGVAYLAGKNLRHRLKAESI